MIFAKLYFRLIALLTILFGVTLLLWPGFVLSLFFRDVNIAAEFFTRIAASTLIGFATLNFLVSRVNDRELYVIGAWSNLSTLLIAGGLSGFYISKFDQNAFLLAMQHGLFASGFLYILLSTKKLPQK